MKTYHKLLIDLAVWHLKPYRIARSIQATRLVEYGFLCFRYVCQQSKEDLFPG